MTVRKEIAKQRKRRQFRVRNRVRRDAHGRPRLSVFRSNRHIYAQIIDDAAGHTLVSASSLEGGSGKYCGNKDSAAEVGKTLAQRATEKGIKEVVFDRGVFRYHGRIAALADAAREGGLEF